jgi:predicted nucleic acid-binding protein
VRIATVDSSTLINLTHLELIRELSLFFDIVYVPRAVQSEVNRKGRFRHRLNNLYEGSILRKCATADETNVKLLHAELDLGESEAIIQAQEKDASFFIGDEKRARAFAQKMGLTAVGTLRILARLDLEGRAPELDHMVKKLRRDLGFRASDELVRQAMEMASQSI